MSAETSALKSTIHLPAMEEIHDGESWAVSYADFLMVLLSFFIIFFSFSEQKTETIIERIVSETDGAKGEGDQGGSGRKDRGPSSKTGLGGGPQQTMKEIIQNVKIAGFQVENVKKQLIFHFPDKIYRPGRIDLDAKGKKQMVQLLDALKKYLPHLDLVFIGHTDDSRFRRYLSKHIQNNFDLSVLRATRALKTAIDWGADVRHISAKGVAYQMRNTRSLSLILIPRSNNPDTHQ